MLLAISAMGECFLLSIQPMLHIILDISIRSSLACSASRKINHIYPVSSYNWNIPGNILVTLLCTPFISIIFFLQCATITDLLRPKQYSIQMYYITSRLLYAMVNENKYSTGLLHCLMYMCCHLQGFLYFYIMSPLILNTPQDPSILCECPT